MTKISVRRYPSGQKVYIVTQGTEPNRRREVIGTNKEQAERVAADWAIERVDVKRGLAPPSTELEKAKEKYLKNVQARCAPRTHIRYTEYLDHFTDFLRDNYPQVQMVAGIQTLHVEEFIQYRLHTAKRATKTVTSEKDQISTFFDWCWRMGYLRENPVKRVSRFRVKSKKPRAFKEEELRRIFKYSGAYELLYRSLYYTGFRLAEVCSMKAGDVDLKENTILYHNLKAGKEETVEINKNYRPHLEKLLKGKKPEELLFSFPGEGSTKFNKLRCDFHKLLAKLGMLDGTLHGFKHSFVTHLLNNGVPPTVVQLLAHHTSLQTTVRYYGGPTEKQMKGAIDKLPL